MSSQIIAHRGASYLASHENTMEAFQIAMDVHADAIELDVRQTLDKVLVVYHDETMNAKPIRTLTYQQLESASEASGYHIPTLEEVLKFCQNRIQLLIELKEAGYEKQLISMVNTYYSYEQYCLQSFLDIVVRRIKKIDPNVTTGLLVGVKGADFRTHFNEYFPIRRLRDCHADFISAYYMLTTPDFLLRMTQKEIPVYAWTTDEPKAIRRLLEAEIDGIITNRPEAGVYLRSRYEKQKAASDERRTRTALHIRKLVSRPPKSK